MATPVPSLSTAGWVTDPAAKADVLMSHYFLSNKSQTAIYGENVSSCQYTIQKYSGRIEELTTRLRDEIEKYMRRYFDAANAIVTNDLKSNTGSQINLSIQCDVIQDNQKYTLGGLLEINNSKFSKFTSINNA